VGFIGYDIIAMIVALFIGCIIFYQKVSESASMG